MFEVRALPGFADVDARLSLDADTRIAVTLLVYQAFAAGQQDGMSRVAGKHLSELLPVNDDINAQPVRT